MTPGQTQRIALTFRVYPGTEGIAGRLQELAGSLDPALVVDEVLPLDVLYEKRRIESLSGVAVLALSTLSVLLLSAAGMYAMMSFTLNQRQREIGIRSALGAPSGRLLGGIFGRSLAQIAVGVAAGLITAAVSSHLVPIEELGGRDVPGVLVAAAIFMLAIGTLAGAGPARRALRLAPAEALRDGG